MQVLIRMPEKMKQNITIEAKKKGISVNALLLNILWERYGDETVKSKQSVKK